MTDTTPTKKRFKWEPMALMVIVLGLGVWLVWNSKNRLVGIHPDPTSRTVEFRLGNSRGVVEISGDPATASSQPRFRVLLRNKFASDWMSESDFEKQYGTATLNDVVHQGDNALFRLLNITSWVSLVWVSVGFAGQFAFAGRMLVQWFVSEQRNESVVPASFWWMSLVGGVLLFAYFVWRQDFVGVMGQSSNLVIYARNLKLIAKHKRSKAGLEG
jgi:lipid-A-disaccharide synthase-like uncharacterized protein